MSNERESSDIVGVRDRSTPKSMRSAAAASDRVLTLVAQQSPSAAAPSFMQRQNVPAASVPTATVLYEGQRKCEGQHRYQASQQQYQPAAACPAPSSQLGSGSPALIVPGSSPTSGGASAAQLVMNTSTPCAACKLLRRRCAQECPFAPYFSPHEPHRFASVHKIYGASNVSKMLSEVPETQRADAANSLVYEANARIRDPIYGCTGLVTLLQQQAQSLQVELNAVRSEIMRYRACHEVATMQGVATTGNPQHMPNLSPQPFGLLPSTSTSLRQAPLQTYGAPPATAPMTSSSSAPHADHLNSINRSNIIVTSMANVHNAHHQLSPHPRVGGPSLPTPTATTSSPNHSKERLVSWP